MKKILVCMLLASFNSVAAEDIHQFSSGEVLKASVLNSNFSQLNASIDENAQKIASLSVDGTTTGLTLNTSKNDVIEGETCTSLTNFSGMTYTIKRQIIQTDSEAFEFLYPNFSGTASSGIPNVTVKGELKNNSSGAALSDKFNGYQSSINAATSLSQYGDTKSEPSRVFSMYTQLEDHILLSFTIPQTLESSSGISSASQLLDDANEYYSAVTSCLYIGKL